MSNASGCFAWRKSRVSGSEQEGPGGLTAAVVCCDGYQILPCAAGGSGLMTLGVFFFFFTSHIRLFCFVLFFFAMTVDFPSELPLAHWWLLDGRAVQPSRGLQLKKMWVTV